VNDVSIDLRNFVQLCHKVPAGYSGIPHIHMHNCPFPFDDQDHLIHPSLDQPHSPPQMASRSNQSLFHLTDRSTNGPTDGIGDKFVPNLPPPYSLLCGIRKKEQPFSIHRVLEMQMFICFLGLLQLWTFAVYLRTAAVFNSHVAGCCEIQLVHRLCLSVIYALW